MKQTAVEWLVDEYFGGIENCTPDFRFHIQQAKEMEKEQIIDAYDRGHNEYDIYRNGQNYYNETFKSE